MAESNTPDPDPDATESGGAHDDAAGDPLDPAATGHRTGEKQAAENAGNEPDG